MNKQTFMTKSHFIRKNISNSMRVLLVLSAVLLAGPARAATVTTTADNGPGSLRETIANAVPGETIDFAVIGPIILTSGELVIDKDLTIAGPGSDTLLIQRSLASGTPDFRILHVLFTSLTVSGLTMNNGRADSGGGMLCEHSAVVLMRDVILSGSAANSYGGGLVNDGTLALEDCAFINNSVQAIEGSVAYGGGLANWGTIFWLDHCFFEGNSATGASGGGGGFGGAINNSSTIVSMDGCVLGGNWAAGGPGIGNGFGGGINNDFGTLTLTNCTLTGNSATGGSGSGFGFGGGLYNDFGTVFVDACTVSGNVARGGSGREGGLAEGGGVANGFGTVELNLSTVSGNWVVGGEGDNGGFGAGGGVANDSGTVYLYNSTVSGNVANGGVGTVSPGAPQGGGLFNGYGSVIADHSTVAANSVPGGLPNDGGGVFNLAGLVEIKNTIVAANNATVDSFNDEFAETFSYGFNLFGSTAGLFTAGTMDQFNLTAATLQLGPLQDNGGPTFTHALLCGSPAIDAGDNTNAPATDQRGFPRIVGGIIDIGAYEADTNAPPAISCPDPITLNCAPPAGLAASLSVVVADAEGDPLMVVWSVNGTARQTNAVAGGSPAARVDFTAGFAVGAHQVTVSATDPGGCSATCAAVMVTVHPNPPPPTIIADGALTFARGGSVTLTSRSATGNNWSTGATTPSILVTNSGSFTVTVTDTNGCSATSAAVMVTVTNGPGPGGKLYPIALHQRNVTGKAAGSVLADIYNGVQPGNFGWLTWAGSPSEPTLARSLTPPGNSETYTNPHDANDHLVSVGDWVQGTPGVSNSRHVRAALDALKEIDITVPVWDQALGTGNNSLYRVAAFARVRLTRYQLPRENRITARFLGMVDSP